MAKKKRIEDKPRIEGKNLKEFADNANSTFGLDWVVDSAALEELGATRLPTGILELDLILRGGVPHAQAMTLFGADSTGKTVLMMLDAAQTVRTCRQCYTPIIEFTNYEDEDLPTKTTCMCGKCDRMNAFVADGEMRWDMVWGHTLGLPRKGEPGYENFWIVRPETADRLTDLARDAINQQLIDKLYVDSFTSLFPESQTGRTALEQQPGSAAKAITSLISTISNQNARQGVKGRKVTIVGSTQVRSKIGVSFGDPREMPGGWMLKHMRSIHFDMYSPKKDESIKDDKRSAGDVTHYVDFRAKLKKSSMGGGEGASANWRVYVNQYGDNPPGATDNYKRLVEHLKTVKLVGKVKGGYHLLGFEVDTMAEIKLLASDPAIQRAGLYALLACTTSAQTRDYLDIKRYDYNPFYRINVEWPDEDAEDDEGALPRIELVPRDTAGKKTEGPKKKRKKRKGGSGTKES